MKTDLMIKLEEYDSEALQSNINIKKVNKTSDTLLWQNKILAYLDDQLSFDQRSQVESVVAKNKDLFEFMILKKESLERVDFYIPNINIKNSTRQEIKVELQELADTMLVDKRASLLGRVRNLLSK
ncbi:MAG: hypothetical protein ACI9QD_000723 [Thermoproteota archaeon]|jgi:hypothetical protein